MEVLEFQIPNEWGSHLKDIFTNVDVEIYDWVIGENTEILGEGNESIFDTLTMSGRDFLENINLPNYYVIHALFLAYPKGSLFEPINDFDDFSSSDCKIALIIIDCTDVDLYAKDSAIIQQVMRNALEFNFANIRTFSDTIEMKKYFQPLLGKTSRAYNESILDGVNVYGSNPGKVTGAYIGNKVSRYVRGYYGHTWKPVDETVRDGVVDYVESESQKLFRDINRGKRKEKLMLQVEEESKVLEIKGYKWYRAGILFDLIFYIPIMWFFGMISIESIRSFSLLSFPIFLYLSV